MVKLTFASTTFLFLAAILAGSRAVASPAGAEPLGTNQVMQTMSKISTDVTNLGKSVESIGDNLTVRGAIALHYKFKTVKNNLDKLYQDVNAVKSISNAQAILDAVQRVTPTVVRTLKKVADKKAVFDRMAASKYVLEQLSKAKGVTTQIADTLIAMGPNGLRADGTHTRNDLEHAFDVAIGAYQK